MRIERFVKSLDELETDLIVTTLFENERPPRAVTGMVDWRLNGFISRAILAGIVVGSAEEFVLLPLHRRLPARRLLLVGLGNPEEYRLAAARHCAFRVARALASIGTFDAAVSFPKACDERLGGETERAVLDVFAQADLPRDLLLYWLDPSVVRTRPAAVRSAQEARA